MRKVNRSFWENKKVFLTGHTGFKGSWLSLWLQEMGADVMGYGLEPPTTPSLFNVSKVGENMNSIIGDIKNFTFLKEKMISFNPDILIHMAAQSLVRLSYSDPLNTYETNVIGTANVLESARYCNNLKAVISVTTDKCYENQEWLWGYREDDAIGGHDPYSSSKGCAELVSSAFRRSYFSGVDSPAIATARAGNVIGGGDWALDRLIPDSINAFSNFNKVEIRNPMAIRPWQHVLEPLSGYLILAEELCLNGQKYAQAWNFGPRNQDCKSVSWVLDSLISLWGEEASWSYDRSSNPHEANLLKLDCSKAEYYLNWEPKWDINYALKKVVDWYRYNQTNIDMRAYTISEINEYNS
jgi:CDP-glucose 4,6-dehydratase